MTYSPTALANLEDIRAKVSLPISEGTSVTIKRAIIQLTRYFKDGRNRPEEMLAYIPSISNQLNCAMYSERNKLSSSVIDLITALSAGLGPSFEPLISLFIPTLLWFCTQPNKAFTREVKRCLLALIRNTKIKSLLPYIAHLDTSASLRLVAAEAILACLNSKSFEPPNLDNDTRAYLVEDVIKLTTRDGCAKVRRAGKEIFGVYKIVFPERIERFIEALPPAAKEDLTSPLTPVEVTGENQTEGGVGTAASLQAKNISVKQTERQVRPLGSKLPRVVAAPKQATITCQNMLHPPPDSCSTPKRRIQRTSPACPSVPAIQGTHGDKLRIGERTRTSLVCIAAAPEGEGAETAPTQKTHCLLLKPNSARKPQITKGDPERNATKIPIVRTKLQPFTKGEHTTSGDLNSRIVKRRSDAPLSTEAEVQTSSRTCRDDKVLRWQSKTAKDQKKPAQGGPVIDGPKSVVKLNKKVVDERKLGGPVINVPKFVVNPSEDERKLVRERRVTNRPKPVVKAPPTSNLKRCDTKKLDSGKPVPKDIPLPSRIPCRVRVQRALC